MLSIIAVSHRSFAHCWLSIAFIIPVDSLPLVVLGANWGNLSIANFFLFESFDSDFAVVGC